jgi:hypothetical protein
VPPEGRAMWSSFHLAALAMALNNFISIASAQAIPLRYPWVTSNQQFDNHQANLLNQIKAQPLHLLTENLPLELLQEPNSSSLYYSYQNKEYSCNVTTSPSASQENSLSGSGSGLSVQEIRKQFEKKILKTFTNLCLNYQVDWWSYEWCHEAEVEQFHLERGRRGKVIKDPQWSLGTFDFTEYDREKRDGSEEDESDSDSDSGDLVRVRQYFSKGQICHENNHQRSSEVLTPLPSWHLSVSLSVSLCLSLSILTVATIGPHLLL